MVLARRKKDITEESVFFSYYLTFFRQIFIVCMA